MGCFYIDDSVHDGAGFIIGACVYTEIDLTGKILEIIKYNGFDPDKFEYKSSSNYSKEPEKAKVRSDLKGLLHEFGKLGIVVIPREHREQLGIECIKGLNQFINHNTNLKKPLTIFFDQGMFNSINKANELITDLNFTECSFELEQNSKLVLGIQLADLAAHVASIQLKDRMGLIEKMVKAGLNSGYDPDMEMELGFEMWATLRYSFFSQHSEEHEEHNEKDTIKQATLDVEPYGLYISGLCDKELSTYARAAFDKVYLGCIH